VLTTCPLSELAVVRLGFKSLQNAFFYVTPETVADYKIEDRYLRPIKMLKELDTAAYLQAGEGAFRLFHCAAAEGDLRGTGALRYIRAMARRPATQKKQSAARAQTIQEALRAQGGPVWYAPKAVAHKSHVWLRKAIDAVYAPFLFDKAAALDQRCNGVVPRSNLPWELVAAALTTTLFSLALECQGAASLGAGALEVPTRSLREVPVVDVRGLTASEAADLVRLAWAVWERERPADWRREPGRNLRELDGWVLQRMGGQVRVEQLYDDLARTCAARLRLASDKTAKVRKALQVDIGSVAEALAGPLAPLMEGRQYPEAFFGAGERRTQFRFPSRRALTVVASPMMDRTALLVRIDEGEILVDRMYARDVATVVVTALLLGRREFDVPEDPCVAARVIEASRVWLANMVSRVDEACRSTSLGTRYEEQVREQAMRVLHLHPALSQPDLFGEFYLEP